MGDDIQQFARNHDLDAETVREWLRQNPPPDHWTDSRLEWLRTEMPVTGISAFF